MWDGDAFGREIAEMVAQAIERATGPLKEKIEGLKASPAPDVWRSDVLEIVAEAIKSLPEPVRGPPGEPGERGERGEKGDPGAEASDGQVAEAVARWFEFNPAPRGEKGDPGERGPAGERGERGDQGERGEKGDPGERGERGEAGEKGDPGEKGRDAPDIARAFKDESGQLVLTMTNGDVLETGIRDGERGLDGKDGERGPEGFSLKHFDTEVRDGGRIVLMKFEDGQHSETHELQFAGMIYRGVFSEDRQYEIGDTCTYQGGLWYCAAPTSEKPGDGSKGWSLAIRRGRDGKSVTVADVMPAIEARMKEIEDVLVKRLDMALARRGGA